MIVSEEVRRALIERGLSEKQVDNKYVGICLDLFAEDGARLAIKEAEAKNAEAAQYLIDARAKAREIEEYAQRKRDEADSVCAGIVEAEKKYGVLEDKRAITAVQLFVHLIEIGKAGGADPDDAVNSAGYMVYAFLGGKARVEENENNEGWTRIA